jgi:hypothetical protein
MTVLAPAEDYQVWQSTINDPLEICLSLPWATAWYVSGNVATHSVQEVNIEASGIV